MGMLSQIKPYKITNSQNDNGQNKKNSTNKKGETTLVRNYLFDKVRDESTYTPTQTIVIPTPSYNTNNQVSQEQKTKSFDIKKAIVPLLVGTVAILGGMAGAGSLLKKAAKTKLTTDPLEQLPNLAINNNIREETLFSAYMALRNPSTKNILGAVGVFTMSGVTLVFKNLVDGVKDIWIKKQESDIQRDLQEKLIDTETRVFAGKLQVERNILGETAQYFEKELNTNPENKSNTSFSQMPVAFRKINSFKGATPNQTDTPPTKINEKAPKPTSSEKTKKDLIYGGLIGATSILSALLGIKTLKTLKQTADIATKYTEDATLKTINFIEETAKKKSSGEIEKISTLFKVISAKPEFITETLKKMDVPENKIQEVIKDVEATKKTVFSDAPTALGGITNRIQYYCYLNEDRGHLYNWILNPENKYLKYLFLASTGITAIGYITQQCVDAMKSIAVSKENANTELSLQNRLIDVEVKNFKSKKDCAVKPLIEEFDIKKQKGTDKEELKTRADNILVDIKNGAPCVYS